ncbi:MAG TPA: alpha/beta hydrolase-fold protein [Sphingomicrobium sp.]|nr:alpha/beta hydrolase-fold protein [Sphingomicrobium sp.]
MRRIAAALIALAGILLGPSSKTEAQTQARNVPRVAAGRIVDLGEIRSKHTDPRRVVVWLPSTYRPGGPRHAVLYMHDGQNLFDRKTAGYGMEWQVDETLDRLIRQKEVRPTIVVGIWNTPKRLREYVPSKAFAHLPPKYMEQVRGLYGGNPLSDGYLKFIVEELKPTIEKRFRVKTDRANTAIMGSSMGALISLYAIDEYPQVFGSAGMVSTHWPLLLPADGGKAVSDEEYAAVSGAFERYLDPALPDPRNHRLYFDHGTETLDAVYARYQKRVDDIVAKRGYRLGANWISRNFPGQAHNEKSWASRVEIPLRFLLPPERMARR